MTATSDCDAKSSTRYYDNLQYDRNELLEVMRRTYDELIDFVTTTAFRATLAEMDQYPREALPVFVKYVLLNETALAARGVKVPDGILIQRSAFGDRRPTLFVVKKFLPEKYHKSWENVNITFDLAHEDSDVSRDPLKAWRPPLHVERQSQMLVQGRDLEAADPADGLVMGAFGGTKAAKPPA